MKYWLRRAILSQQIIFPINLGIFHHISWNVGPRKNLSYFWKSVNKYYGEHFSEMFVVISSWNSSKISEGEEIFLQLLRQCGVLCMTWTVCTAWASTAWAWKVWACINMTFLQKYGITIWMSILKKKKVPFLCDYISVICFMELKRCVWIKIFKQPFQHP